MSDFLREVDRLEAAIAEGESGASGATGFVVHLYQKAVLTSNREALALAEQRLGELMLRVGPRSDLRLLQANIDMTLHRFADARRVLEQSTELANSTFGHVLAADLDVQDGELVAAITAYESVIAQDCSWENLARLAHVKGVTGDRATADELYLAAEDELTAKQMRAFAWLELQRGQLAFKQGDFACAAERYARAQKAYSGYWLIDQHRAELFGAQREWRAARALYEDILRRVDRPEIWHAFGDVLAAEGNSAEASRAHDRARAGYLQSISNGDVHYIHHLAHLLTPEPEN